MLQATERKAITAGTDDVDFSTIRVLLLCSPLRGRGAASHNTRGRRNTSGHSTAAYDITIVVHNDIKGQPCPPACLTDQSLAAPVLTGRRPRAIIVLSFPTVAPTAVALLALSSFVTWRRKLVCEEMRGAV